MADYPSIETKIEDAVAVAFAAFTGGPTGFTYYKSNLGAELVLPAIVIQCLGFEKAHPDAEAGARNNFNATVNIIVVTDAEDSSRVIHGNLYGWAQAIGIRSADQMVTELNAAAVAGFTASAWGIESGGQSDFDDQRRVSTLTFSLICSVS